MIQRHINRLVSGTLLPGLHAGFHSQLKAAAAHGRFRKAVSVGCGTGRKEAGLVLSGLVDTFHLFDISGERIHQGRAFAEAKGISDSMLYFQSDPFVSCRDHDYDLVYWNNALHHMPDVRLALNWSRGRLVSGGILGMDDFIGPSRFQWSDLSLDYANRFRQSLLPRHFVHPTQPDRLLSRRVRRPDPELLMATDPSEAADSGNIISALYETFPNASVTLTGGAIYNLGLKDVLANIDEIQEAGLLGAALLLDEALIQQNESHYAVAIASAE